MWVWVGAWVRTGRGVGVRVSEGGRGVGWARVGVSRGARVRVSV